MQLESGFLQVSLGQYISYSDGLTGQLEPYRNYREDLGWSVWGCTLITKKNLAGQFGNIHKIQRGFRLVSSGPYINYSEDFGRSPWDLTCSTLQRVRGQVGELGIVYKNSREE